MKILNNGTPWYPDRGSLNVIGVTVTDDVNNLCTTLDLRQNATATAGFTVSGGTLAANAGASISGGAFSVAAPNSVNLGEGTVTQATSLATGVTVNAASGVITTVSATTAAQAVATFTVTNSAVGANSVVLASLGAYSGTFGTNGTPIVTTNTVAAGSFKVTIYNAHATAALAGTLAINFAVV